MQPLILIFLAFLIPYNAISVSGYLSYECKTCSDCLRPVITCEPVCTVCTCSNTTIDCSEKSLKKSFSTNITDWKLGNNIAFDTLNLNNNLIGRVVQFPSLPIKRLNLAVNVISEIDYSAFYRLSNLEELDLSHNQLTSYDLSGDKFRGQHNDEYFEPLPVKILNLSSNAIHKLSEDVFEHLPLLERLSLSKNPIGWGLDQSTVIALASVPKIQVLDLSYTNLGTLPPFLQNLPELRELILSHNFFTLLPSDSLAHATALQILHLSGNPIVALTSATAFPKMPELEQLHMSFMPNLRRIDGKSLQGLTGLTYLSCHSNIMLSSISADAVSSKSLIKLDLHDNHLSYLPEKLIENWETIKEIDIQGNVLLCDCENQWILTRLFPKMKNKTDSLTCFGPPQMKGTPMAKLYETNYHMRCLDYYGNHPERDGSFMIATFVIIVIALVSLGIYFVVRNRRWRRTRDIDYTAIYQQHVQDNERI